MSGRNLDAGLTILSRLFRLDPSLRSKFNPESLEATAAGLIQAVRMAVDALDDWTPVLPELTRLGVFHSKLGIQPEHYELLGVALVGTMREFARDVWSLETEDAWLDFFAEMSNCMETAGTLPDQRS